MENKKPGGFVSRNKKILLISLLSFVSFFSTLWIRSADLMESRNFISAREIVLNNEWFVTTLNGEYRFEKPPLPTWLTALVMKIFNNFSDEWLLRIPVALICLLLVFYIYKLVKISSDSENLAFITSFVASSTFMLTKIGAENAWDTYPYVFMFGAITYMIIGLKNQNIAPFLISGFLFACSLLSKGPVAIYGMFIPFIISYIFVYRCDEIKNSKKKILLALLMGVSLAMIWPVGMIIENKQLFMSVLNKEKNTWTTRHVRGFFYYFNYFVYMGSWAVFSIIPFLKKWDFGDGKKNRFFKFGISWNILTLLFLSFVKMKKERYGLPIYIVATIPIGVILDYYLNKKWKFLKKFDRIIFYIQFALIVIASFLGIVLLKWKSYLINFKNFWLFLIFIGFFIFIIGDLFKNYFKEKNNFKKKIILYSGLVLVLVNVSLTWIIEQDIRGKKNKEHLLLETLQKTKLDYPVYSENFSIEDVWSVGKQIVKHTPEKELPDKFYYLSEKPLDQEKFENYNVELVDDFYRFKNRNKIIYIYFLQKIE